VNFYSETEMSEKVIENKKDEILLNKWLYQLENLGKQIKGEKFREVILWESTLDLIYILKRISKLNRNTEIEISSANQEELKKYKESIDAIRFYSQCLLLWSCRILEILREISNVKIPHDFHDVRIARNILVAHFGTARGRLKEELDTKKGFITSPKFSPDGNFEYVIGPLGSPSSIASSPELEDINRLHKKYCPSEPDCNVWNICFKILCSEKNKSRNDLKRIEEFIRNNGGAITSSKRIIECVIDSIENYLARNAKRI